MLKRTVLCGVLLLLGPCAVPSKPQSTGAAAATDRDKVRITLAELMTHYEPDKGLWATEGWWNAANTTTALADAASVLPSKDSIATLQNTFVHAQGRFPLFRNEFFDDEGWWALAWIEAYDVTHRTAYLEMAESIFRDMTTGWDSTCGGGIWWKKDRHYKNAIANELFLSVASHLATRSPVSKRGEYLEWAKREWAWFDQSGMLNDDNLVNDGLTPDCKNNKRNTWTYNQGVLLGGLVELAAITKDQRLSIRAGVIAHAAIGKLTDQGQVLHDRTEPNCGHDVIQFKGIFVRNLASLQKASPDPAYVAFLRANADSVWNNARTDNNEFACTWAGPAKDDGAAASTSALDALVAVVR